jgi:hypothetical protein
MDVETTKRCPQCNADKPMSEFFRRGGDRGQQLQSWCKTCLKPARNRSMMKTYRRDPLAWIEKQHEQRSASPIKYLVTQSRRRAKLDGLEHSITTDDLVMPSHCPLLGIPLFFSRGRPTPNTPTIDRFNPRLGYVPGNVWVISYRANTIKSDATLDELLTLTRNLSVRARLKVVA